MRAFALLVLLLALPDLAPAQSVFERALGQYGSATDPATSCAANPHQLDFMAQPLHAMFNWQTPKVGPSGAMVSGERYDILDYDDHSLTLRQEGDVRRTDSGAQPVWILRLTADPQGYCWGRTDWPQVHCEDQQLRCDNPSS